MRLSEVPDGVVVKVVDLDASDELRERLLGLGFVPGQIVVVKETAPLGNPRVYMVGQKLVTLREAEARIVKVRFEDSIPLEMANPGRYTVVALNGGHHFRRKMADLGLREGVEIEVVHNRGAILIRIYGEEVVVGRGQARKILLKPLEGLTR